MNDYLPQKAGRNCGLRLTSGKGGGGRKVEEGGSVGAGL